MMTNGHSHSDFSENMQRCHDYVMALEEERRKIQVFQRELPLCLELVTQAIGTCKQQLSGTTNECNNLHGQSECSEETSSDDGPVFEEFIPLKRASSDSHCEEQESKKLKDETSDACNKDGSDCTDKNCKKADWLRSVQLWNQTPDPPSKEESSVSELKGDGTGGAFHPFSKEKNTVGDVAAAAPPLSPSCTAEAGAGNKKEEKEGHCRRKTRRCWSPELHRRFLQALQQLGGSHVATPKQIRELMKVDGLTNDEVKSHLQKYRLHTRRPSTSSHNNNAQPPQFVVVGGIWVSPEYSTMTATATSSEESAPNKIYAPIAAPPTTLHESSLSPKQRRHIKPSAHSNDSGSYRKGNTQSCSPVSSSSAHTATVSPAC